MYCTSTLAFRRVYFMYIVLLCLLNQGCESKPYLKYIFGSDFLLLRTRLPPRILRSKKCRDIVFVSFRIFQTIQVVSRFLINNFTGSGSKKLIRSQSAALVNGTLNILLINNLQKWCIKIENIRLLVM